MVRVRKLVLAIAAASALTSGMAHALGLGEVTLKSALNQPLDAEITLLDVRDLDSTEVLPKLASPEDFNKAGVDRQYFLTDLKFTPILKPNGQSVIRVTSSKPVREPYLNFLVEVLWPNGRLLREYTLLLDPPLYSPQVATAAAPQLPIAAPAPRPATAAPAPRPTTPVAAPATRPAAPAQASIQGNEYRTSSNDTLWQIAERTRSAGSVHQTMLAIQDLNPDAFIDGNINRMKSGQVLRLPDEQQVRSRSQSEALAQVAVQNTAWREGRSLASGGVRQLDATKRAAAGAAPAQAQSADSLKLVSGDAGKAAGKGAAGDSKALTDKLAVTQESLDTTRRENDELKSRMTDLQSQLDKLQRLIQLKDEQLAKLQADLATRGQAVPTEVLPAESAPAAPAEQAASQPEGTQATAPAPGPEPVDAQAEAPDYNYSEEPAEEAAPQPAATPAPAAQAPAEQPAPAPVEAERPAPAPAAEEQPQPGFVDDLLANPMLPWIAGGSGLLVLLILLMALSRRNAQRERELQDSLAAEESDTAFASDLDLPASEFEGLESVDAPATQQQQSDDRVTAQTSDALGEADIYIAYGRFNQAAELLQNAINDEPNRSDLRLKLMEVQAELGDREGFLRQESELREIGGASAEVEQLKGRYPAMAAVAAAGVAAAALADKADDLNFDDLSFDDEQVTPVSKQEEAFDLSLDDLASELESELSGASSAETSVDFDLGSDADATSTAGVDDGFDFDLEVDEVPTSNKATDELADFSLELDEASATADEDFSLSLDDDLAVEPKGDELSGAGLDFELPEGAAELPADFDLSLDDEVASPSGADFAAQLEEASAGLDQFDELEPVAEPKPAVAAAPDDAFEGDDDFDFLSGTDETATKLDLARAYIDMGDVEGARDILDEVLAEGSDGQQQEARELIARLV
ncbi:FimV family protein [Zestomonas carbonaria]|uniref:FimV N-terminal domain-containing protein n=1 Tax=Zestomonas carbonaria TaxID=2762745 RepID=A0A7U7ET28_9GAMM|nr:FimV family protein [Pseudomonas carbonaria]CAD5109745.1 hypothetical protein PSEWESI4_04056 [Pseudomonas carbonaria]